MSSSPKSFMDLPSKEYLFTTICHSKKSYTLDGASSYKMALGTRPEIGKDYDVYKAKYFFTIEFEIYRYGQFIISFVHDKKQPSGEIIEDFDIEDDNDFLNVFYTKGQMRDIKLKDLGI